MMDNIEQYCSSVVPIQAQVSLLLSSATKVLSSSIYQTSKIEYKDRGYCTYHSENLVASSARLNVDAH